MYLSHELQLFRLFPALALGCIPTVPLEMVRVQWHSPLVFLWMQDFSTTWMSQSGLERLAWGGETVICSIIGLHIPKTSDMAFLVCFFSFSGYPQSFNGEAFKLHARSSSRSSKLVISYKVTASFLHSPRPPTNDSR